MPDETAIPPGSWPAGLTRIPFWVYKDRAVLDREQQRVFEGPVWNYLCLESEIPNTGDWRAAGESPQRRGGSP